MSSANAVTRGRGSSWNRGAAIALVVVAAGLTVAVVDLLLPCLMVGTITTTTNEAPPMTTAARTVHVVKCVSELGTRQTCAGTTLMRTMFPINVLLTWPLAPQVPILTGT
jgi:hypothetical protein